MWRDWGSMTVVLDKQPTNYLYRLNEPGYSRILDALEDLTDDPPGGDIRKLRGEETAYRLKVGGYRILFKVKESCIAVYKIAPRGQVYKEN
jgi:mRNA interferase RelE/StbE